MTDMTHFQCEIQCEIECEIQCEIQCVNDHLSQMEMEARAAAEQGPAAAVAMKTVAAFFGGDAKAKAAAAAISSPTVQGGRMGSPGGRMQTALPQRRLWELFASGSNTEEEQLAMQDLPEGQYHDDEEDIKEQQEASKSKSAGKGALEEVVVIAIIVMGKIARFATT